MLYAIKRKGILFVLIGPSGSGKSTLCSRLVQEFDTDLRYSVSVTSRPPRQCEVPGVSYHFVSREDFVAKKDRGEFFEWEETHGNFYGTLRSTLDDGIEGGSDLLFQIDIRGALTLKRNFPKNTVSVFLIPPSFETLKDRIATRGSLKAEELDRRFATARQEYDSLLALAHEPGKIDYVIVNHDLDAAYGQVRAILIAERSRYLRMDGEAVASFCHVGDSGR